MIWGNESTEDKRIDQSETEGGAADVKVLSQHLSGMVEENHRSPVE
jgi:hypothetical protein